METSAIPQSAIYTPVTFRWNIPGSSVPIVATPLSSPAGLQLPTTPDSNISGFFLPARHELSAAAVASLFSELSKGNKEQRFTNDLKEQFNQIKSVSVEVEAGAHALFISVDGVERKIPINLFSAAASRIAAVLLHIAKAANGVVFIDEIENGIHYSRLERYWKQIFKITVDSNSQVFASVHSLEALKAALPCLADNLDAFSLVQVFRESDGISRAVVVPGKEAAAAIENDIEVRGRSTLR
jgi:hypothetical protein